MMLRMAREVAWLSEGSCTDQVISAAATTPDSAIRPSPLNSRSRRPSASRNESGRWPTRGMTRSIAGMLNLRAWRLTQGFDQPMHRLGCGFTVGDQREADIARAGIGTVILLPRQIAARDHPDASVAIEPHGHVLVAAAVGGVEPDAEAAGGPLVAVAIAEDLVGEIELDAIEPAVLLDMGLVAVGSDGYMLQRHRHLGCGDIAQLEERGEKPLVAGGEADSHAWQVRALRQRLERDHVGEVGPGAVQDAARRLAGVDLRIALVGEDHEAEAVGELLQPREIAARSDRALRVGGRGDEECHGARQR